MTNQQPKTIYRHDYQPPHYDVESIHLTFKLDQTNTRVTATYTLLSRDENERDLILQGNELTLVQLLLDEKPLEKSAYQLDQETLTIFNFPEKATLTIITDINPGANTTLSGLYYADQLFCTQCESQGFRRMTYFLDRPDVMTTYTTTIIADKVTYPVLLSNGNLIDQGDSQEGTHYVTWQDPFKKPGYLFALVAGQLDCLSDHYQTMSGRKIDLHIYVEPGKTSRAKHAMFALKQAMKWDEDNFGREYDLDIFMIVAVSRFNMGAMENKGLNIFNDKYILADPETATDTDYDLITLVVGHEYFHNWTGNRITCRDWFQLSLKEGLTVFRESLFMQDQTSPLLRRIDDARTIRTAQFAEDASPMAHPVRPDAYVEINNFYTVTVYNKGAEVIRMLYTLVGKDGFRRGMDAYFDTFDGQAVTIDDLIHIISSTNHVDCRDFLRWYEQAGTPQVRLTGEYNEAKQTYTLSCEQTCPDTPGQTHKKPFVIPIKMGLLDRQGKTCFAEQVLTLSQAEQTFTFDQIPSNPIPSLMRDFSAPVNYTFDYQDEELLHLLRFDTDVFNRWDALQRLASKQLLLLCKDYQADKPLQIDQTLLDTFNALLEDKHIELSLLAECLVLPSETYLAQLQTPIDVDAIFHARQAMRLSIATHCADNLLSTYHANTLTGDYCYDRLDNAKRRLKNNCLSYLMLLQSDEIIHYCMQQFETANNMTDCLSALQTLSHYDLPQTINALDNFYSQWKADHLVLDKWFSLQVQSSLPDRLSQMKRLMQLPEFSLTNPNRVRAVVGAFCMGNPVQFHAMDNSGYVFLTEMIIQIDKLNPQLSARLITPLVQWQRYDRTRQNLMQTQLKRLQVTDSLSKDLFEVVNKSLSA